MKTLFALLFLFLTFALAADDEVGAYGRKSVTYIDAVWLMDRSVRSMPNKIAKKLIDEIKKETSLPRFDYNPVPEELTRNFVRRAQQTDELGIDEIAKLMEETLLSEILKIIDEEKELRGEQLLSEQQKNSFYSDKAKELGLTADELTAVMNSAYLYVPVANRFHAQQFGSQFKAEMNIGILWFKIDPENAKNRVSLVVKKMTRCEGVSQAGSFYAGYSNYKDFAFSKMIEQAARNLKVATQEYEGFQLTGQVLHAKGQSIDIDLGSREGLQTDDLLELLEYRQLNNGEIKRKEVGWVRVVNVKGKDRSTATIVQGDADIGTELKEYPLMKMHIQFGLGSYYTKMPEGIMWGDQALLGDQITSQTENLIGPEIGVAYNLGAGGGISQLFGVLNAGIGFGSVAFENAGFKEDAALITWRIEGAFHKGFYLYGPLKLGISAGAQIQGTQFTVDHLSQSFNTSDAVVYNQFGFYAGMSLGFDLGKQWGLVLGSTYRAFPGDGQWTINDDDVFISNGIDYNGADLSLRFTYRPKSLSIDPLDYIRGNLR